jgi:hypothetical protein
MKGKMIMTLEEFYNKIISDRDIMAEFVKASGDGTLSDFAKQYGCTATDSEIRDYFVAQNQGSEGELDDDDVESVAGGAFDFFSWLNKLFNNIFHIGSDEIKTGTGSMPKSSVVDGGRVNAGIPQPRSTIVGKGIAPAGGTLSKDRISQKL